MQLDELKLVTASNIIKLRTGAGLTQAELGQALSYSDKTISKWERGEAIPDAFVLLRLGEIFGVSVDYLLSSHDAWEKPEQSSESMPSYSVDVIIAITMLGVWTAALTAFVVTWMLGILCWEIFAGALPISILTYMILICAFKRRKYLSHVIAAFVLSLFVALYVFTRSANPWQMFLLAIPAEIIVYLSCNIKKRPIFLRRKRKK